MRSIIALCSPIESWQPAVYTSNRWPLWRPVNSFSMNTTPQQLADLLQLPLVGNQKEFQRQLAAVEFDTRVIKNGPVTCFITFDGARPGREFVSLAYELGVRVFWTKPGINTSAYPAACFLLCDKPLRTYQQWASLYIRQFSLPTVGIAGSNGKTIVKEWLAQLLQGYFSIVKSPKSFNSQIGLPYSLLLTEAYHTLGIFEAGVSKSGEMARLAEIFTPDIGIFTNIGSAHNEGFGTQQQKLEEKLGLFATSRFLVYHKSNIEVDEAVKRCLHVPHFIAWYWKNLGSTSGTWSAGETEIEVPLPFTDQASLENLGHCMGALHALDRLWPEVLKRVSLLENIPLRLSSKKGMHQTQIIDDSYSHDLAGLKIALDFQEQNKSSTGQKKVVVLSEMMESGLTEEESLSQVFTLLDDYQVNVRLLVGNRLREFVERNNTLNTRAFATVEALLEQVPLASLSGSSILIKGNRVSALNQISEKWQAESHGSILEVNLDALRSNLQYIRSLLPGGTRIMAMVKAFAYGSGAEAIARMLELNHIDYLGVAYIDEGVYLRQSGINTPIMVMNPSEEGFEELETYRLEPVVYSLAQYKNLCDYLKVKGLQQFPVHVEIDTGMNRLGFGKSEWTTLVGLLSTESCVKPISIFSHLAASENRELDAFTNKQITNYFQFVSQLNASLTQPVSLTHILNSEGILRFPETPTNMVRLGIALYGVTDDEQRQQHLQLAARWISRVAQVREIVPGDSVSYGRTFVAENPMTIATIDLGYADGFHRSLSNGIGELKVNGEWRPVLGRICMDICMIDITGLEVKEGDEVVIFDDASSLKRLANAQKTIPYEVLTSIGQRVKRMYLAGV